MKTFEELEKQEEFKREFNKIDFSIVANRLMGLRVPQPAGKEALEDRLFLLLYRTYTILHYYGEYQKKVEEGKQHGSAC